VKPVPAADVYGMKFPDAGQGLKMACGENPKSYFGEKGRAPNSRQGEIALVRAAFLKAQEYLQGWRDYESGARAKPPERDLKMDTLAAVLTGGIAVPMHCYRSGDMTTMLGVAAEFGFRIRAVPPCSGGLQGGRPAEEGRHLRCSVVGLVGASRWSWWMPFARTLRSWMPPVDA